MQQVKAALESTTTHGLSRVVSDKPIYVRIAWLMIVLIMLGLFLKGFTDFVAKLQSGPVTTSIETNKVHFEYPDVYVCAENSMSATYSADIDEPKRLAIQSQLKTMRDKLAAFGSAFDILLPQSLQYQLLVDALAHRAEQTVIESVAVYNGDFGFPSIDRIVPLSFYEPASLRCFKWNMSKDLQKRIISSGSSAGLILTLMTDSTLPESIRVKTTNSTIESQVYVSGMRLPVSDWSLNNINMVSPDRRSGVRIYLTSPGEYPSDFAKSFLLGPGKFHTVEIGMNQQSYKAGQFDCLSDPPGVQFVNPFHETPYDHSYSYSYCYYYEYHRFCQSTLNSSGLLSPLPWPLRGKSYLLNMSGPLMGTIIGAASSMPKLQDLDRSALQICEAKRPCDTMEYSACISSVNWPTQNSLAAFINSSVRTAWLEARRNNLSVPALDYLLAENSSSATVTAYVNSNVLKVQLKPVSPMCTQISFSRDYGVSNFIADIGGIMGIYLGASLMTLCEVFELLFDVFHFNCKRSSAVGGSQRVQPRTADKSSMDEPSNQSPETT